MDRYKVCVLGGSGFLGAEICRLIVAMGHQAVSVSRRGRPEVEEPWVEGVEWVSADILDESGAPEAWAEHLAGCEAVIHAVGIAAEKKAERQTFVRLHRDSVAVAAAAAARMGVKKFVFISAAKLPPGLPHNYLQAKLDAESLLQQHDLSVAILRPTFIYASRPELCGALARPLGGRRESCARISPPEPLQEWTRKTRGLRLEKVAMAALRAALQPETQGVLDVAAIDHLGDAMFIQQAFTGPPAARAPAPPRPPSPC